MNVVEVDARLILTLREELRRFDDLWRRQAAALGELVALSGMMHFESAWGQSVPKYVNCRSSRPKYTVFLGTQANFNESHLSDISALNAQSLSI